MYTTSKKRETTNEKLVLLLLLACFFLLRIVKFHAAEVLARFRLVHGGMSGNTLLGLETKLDYFSRISM